MMEDRAASPGGLGDSRRVAKITAHEPYLRDIAKVVLRRLGEIIEPDDLAALCQKPFAEV
jgi:hypothetical protein